ncbi:MAG: hypothetical protein KFF73_04465 [Cyclobacteriaceae bacterium]|nr:hypothetical protein [Cyclobacteriaceae bacterium]
MKEIETIEDVIARLDMIIERSVLENNCLGIFAFVYKKTTEQILTGIEKDRFENPSRMEDFDLIFARLYIQAFHNYFENKDVGRIIHELQQATFPRHHAR